MDSSSVSSRPLTTSGGVKNVRTPGGACRGCGGGMTGAVIEEGVGPEAGDGLVAGGAAGAVGGVVMGGVAGVVGGAVAGGAAGAAGGAVAWAQAAAGSAASPSETADSSVRSESIIRGLLEEPIRAPGRRPVSGT